MKEIIELWDSILKANEGSDVKVNGAVATVLIDHPKFKRTDSSLAEGFSQEGKNYVPGNIDGINVEVDTNLSWMQTEVSWDGGYMKLDFDTILEMI